MNIIYASNNAYAEHLAVSMCSLFAGNRAEEEITVYVLSMDIEEKAADSLKKIALAYGRKLLFIDAGDIRKKFSYAVDTGSFDASILCRFFLGELLPENVSRILYLDCDTVVLGRLKKLYETDLKKRTIGAVMEPTIYPSAKERIGLSRTEPYYNSGMLLIDVDAWRQQKIQEKLLACFEKLNGRSLFGDQDVINAVFRGKIRTISPRYNFFSNYRYYRYRTLIKLSSAYEAIPEEVYKAAKAHPAIVHFAGDERPWCLGNYNPYRRAYDKYLKMTDWAESPKEKGKEKYLFAYHMMNLLTVLFPGFRRMIGVRFGERMLLARKMGKGDIL